MGIRKKFFYVAAASMLAILAVSYLVIYIYLDRTIYNETVGNQKTYVELNRRMADSFMQSIFYTATQIVSDKALGEYLSYDGDDPMERFRNKSAIQTQFSHYSTHQAVNSTYYYRTTLFLSDQIPMSAQFESLTLDNNPYASSNSVFSNEEVKEQDWYLKTLDAGLHIFLNETTDEFCIARKLSNNYYYGPCSSSGTGVMVTGVASSQLEKVFSSVPVTPASGYAVLNEAGELLFVSSCGIGKEIFQEAWDTYLADRQADFNARLSDGGYLVSHCETKYGIRLLFLTPGRDIARAVNEPMKTYTLIFLGIMLFTLLVMYVMTGQITRPLIRLSQAISSVRDTRSFDKSSLHVSGERELVILENSFGQLIDNVNSYIEEIRLQDEREKRSELRALQAQINPHFIFNAMDMVNWLALSRNCDNIAQIVDSIANLMRYSITNADGMVPIGQELTNIREFVSVYQLRHSFRLRFEAEISEDTFLIPKFTLQPLVENSVRHAVPPPGEDLVITVRTYHTDSHMIIEVADNGTGCDARLLNRHLHYDGTAVKVSGGFGIRNVNERISLWFSENSGLVYTNAASGGLTARILLDMTHLKKLPEGGKESL